MSRKAIRSFGGYADAQLRRPQNALARDTFPQSEKEQHIFVNANLSHYPLRDYSGMWNMMALDILEKGEINTYREKEHDLLMDIRFGKYQKEDGSFHESFYEMLTHFEKRLHYAAENTDLPEEPDMKKVQDLVMAIKERVIRDEI